MKRTGLVLFLMVMGSLSLFAAGQTEEPLYENDEYGFSFSYPEEFMEEQVLFPDEVIRLAVQNDFKVPVITASVKKIDAAPDLETATHKVVEFMKIGMPDTSGYEIIAEDMIELEDGSPAALIEFSWILGDGFTTMETASLISFNENYQVTMTGNTVRGLGFPVSELTKICRTLQMQ